MSFQIKSLIKIGAMLKQMHIKQLPKLEFEFLKELYVLPCYSNQNSLSFNKLV